MNKPIIKRKLEEVPDNSIVLIDASRADFIDKDVVEVIEDFMISAPLKNITVELKKSVTREQGFKLQMDKSAAAGYSKVHYSAIEGNRTI